jgi:hypothetical protein
VWGGQRFTDALGTFGPRMAVFWRWLEGPGQDGLASFNHPGTGGPPRFGRFRYRPAMARRLVGMEIFTKTRDYLFQGTDGGAASPLLECLDAGWRAGPGGHRRARQRLGRPRRQGPRRPVGPRAVPGRGVGGVAGAAGVRQPGEGPAVGRGLRRGPHGRHRAAGGCAAAPGRPGPGPGRGLVGAKGQRAGAAARPGARSSPCGAPGSAPAGAGCRGGGHSAVTRGAGGLLPGGGRPGRWAVADAAGLRPVCPARPRATGPWAELGYAIAYASPFWLESR